jgi:hypothetical protein
MPASLNPSTTGVHMDFMSFQFMMTTARNGDPTGPSATEFAILDNNAAVTFSGSGFGGYVNGYPTSGTVSRCRSTQPPRT